MSHRRLTPLERQWNDEVIYLHALWRQGPPSNSSNPNPRHTVPKPKPKPKPISTPIANILPPSNPTSFKKQKKKKATKKNTTTTAPNPWEPDPVPQMETGWPDLLSKPELPPVSAEEQGRFTAVQLQQKGLKSSQEFFSRNRNGDDSMEVDSEEEEDDEAEEMEFFLGVFKKDNELRKYYEKNFEGGVFCCLVCGGIGEKLCKRFKNCVALVQHSIAISKTKQRSAHRAFGRAVCQVLGWNIDRLPSIVLSLDEPLGSLLGNADALANSDNVEDSVTVADHVGGDQNENVQVNNVVDLDKGDQMVGLNKDENIIHDKEISDTLGTVQTDAVVEMDNTDTRNQIDFDELYKDP